jgi:outer membrane protein OmpA-like peptidoglycan-associated protein
MPAMKAVAGWTFVAAGLAAVVATTVAAAAGTPLRMMVDKSHVDLKAHRLEVKMSHPAGQVKVTVVGQSGATLADEEQDFTGRPAGAPLIVTWSPSSDETIATLEVRATDASGLWASQTFSWWSVSIPHEDVNFKTDSADIQDSEAPKLEAAYAKIKAELAKMPRERALPTLFIAGHTDTVGGADHNLKLSQARARSIAAWLRKRGVHIPIAYEGFGESSLLVVTTDNVDEPRNRRVDYFMSDDTPTMKTTGFRPAWKRIP